MTVAQQTWTRTNLHQFAWTMDRIMPKEIQSAFSHSPSLAFFASQKLGDFGGVPMMGMGHDTVSGGYSVVKRVTLGAQAGAKRGASDYDTHNVAPDSNTRFAEGNWRFYTHGFAMSGHERRINMGTQQIASYLESGVRNTTLALADLLADDIHALSSAANAITSLDDLISTNDSVHGLSGATYENYNSRGISARGTAAGSISFASGSFAAQGLSDMRTCYNNASEGMQQPDVIITTYDVHEAYEGALQPQERFQGAVSKADGSFMALAFKGKPVVPDPKCASGQLYMVCMERDSGIRLIALQGADFNFGEWKPSSNQDVMVRPLYFTGVLMIGNRRFPSNKLTGITA